MKLQSLDAFITTSTPGYCKNAYVEFPGLTTLYVRRGSRYIAGKYSFPVLDIAAVEAEVPGKKAFTNLVNHLRENHPELWIFVECVNNPRFAAKLPFMGFIRDDVGQSACFYMRPVTPLQRQDQKVFFLNEAHELPRITRYQLRKEIKASKLKDEDTKD